MREKNGFILIEILVSLAISAIILTALYNFLYQANSSVTRVQRVSSIDTRDLLMQNQMESDLSSAIVLFERKVKSQDGQKAGTAQASGAGSGAKNKKEEYEDVPLKKCFYSKNNGDNLEVLTFVTGNPLKAFKKPKSQICRIIYKVIQDKQKSRVGAGRQADPISFTLFRQESDLLGFEEMEKSKPASYIFVKNIKKIAIEYTVAVKPEEKKDKKDDDSKASQGQKSKASAQVSQEKKEQKVQYKSFKSWAEQEIKNTKKDRPDFCRIYGQLWDDVKKVSRNFEFKFFVCIPEGEPEKIKADKPVAQASTGQGQNVSMAGKWSFFDKIQQNLSGGVVP